MKKHYFPCTLPLFHALSLCLLSFVLVLLGSCQSGKDASQGTEELTEEEQRMPENAIKGLQIDHGLTATLFASEPMMTNPTNMDIDARGRVWICEGYNYRVALNPGHPEHAAGDRILILEDTNGDGVADTSKVFYQGPEVNSALGISVLGNKVIVSVSPKVFIFTDTDGDDVADQKEVLFEGIGGEQHDHGIHSFTFGPDGKLYFNFGNEGNGLLDKHGNVVKDMEGTPVNKSGKPFRQGMIIRCNLDGTELEVLAHNFRNNFEVAVDAFGGLWQSDNDDDGNRSVRINYVMEYGNYGYTDEMTGESWQSSRINLEDSIPLRHWHLNDPGAVPNLLQTGAGSPTGILVYEGDLLPEQFHNQLIHADALPNVVRSYPVQKVGAGYRAELVNIVQGTTDKWFRPSDVTVAPDGSLFIADWYDPGVGGHQVGDLDRGRIFRIAPAGSNYAIQAPALNTPKEAAKALESPNIATRYLAWQKLHAWGEQATAALEQLYQSSNPRYRARALWLLSKVPNQGTRYIQDALKDKDEDIRITAIRAARQLKTDILPLIKQVADDPSAQVRRAALIALRHSSARQAPATWAQLAGHYDGQDRWYLEALGISADKNWTPFFSAWLQRVENNWNTQAGRDIVWRARSPNALPMLQQIIEDPKLDPEQNLKFFRALDFHAKADKQRVLESLLTGKHPKQAFINAIALLQMDEKRVPIIGTSNALIAQSLQAVKGRPEFIQLIEKYKIRGSEADLMDIVLTATSKEMQSKALNALINTGARAMVEEKLHGDTAVAHQIISLLGSSESKSNIQLLEGLVLDNDYAPKLRILATREMARGWSGEDRLVALFESGKLPKLVDSVVIQYLSNAYRAEIKEKVQAYYHLNTAANSTHQPIAELAKLSGDAKKGEVIFTNYCNNCHIVAAKGTDFGPNLTQIGDKLTKDALYKSIIQPDAGISFGYEAYLIKLKDGKEYLGYLANETTDQLSVKVIGGVVHEVAKKDIASRKAYEHSLMPTGLDKGMSQEQLVNLVEYVTTLKK